MTKPPGISKSTVLANLPLLLCVSLPVCTCVGKHTHSHPYPFGQRSYLRWGRRRTACGWLVVEAGLLHSEKSVTLPKTTEAFQDYRELSPWLQAVISHVTFLQTGYLLCEL